MHLKIRILGTITVGAILTFLMAFLPKGSFLGRLMIVIYILSREVILRLLA